MGLGRAFAVFVATALAATLAVTVIARPAAAQPADPEQCMVGGVAVESPLSAVECSVLDGWVNAGDAVADKTPKDPCEWEVVYCDRWGLALVDMALQRVPVPDNIGALTTLRGLNLSESNHKSFPSGMYELPNLQWLVLDENELSEIPPELGRLRSLRLLDLNSNYDFEIGKPRVVPVELTKLSELEVLGISFMSIKSLPPEMENLSELRWLDVFNPLLENPRYHAVPEELANLTKLCHIGIDPKHENLLPEALVPLANAGYDTDCQRDNHPHFKDLLVWFEPPLNGPNPGPEFILGDVDCSGRLNVIDALAIAMYSVQTRKDGGPCPLTESLATHIAADRADFNSDGSINIIDALMVVYCSTGHVDFCA